MTKTQTQTDITIRGGLINVPHRTDPNQPPRHQPATPRNKKHTDVRSDHQPAPAKEPPQPDKPQPPAAALDVPPPDKTETETPD